MRQKFVVVAAAWLEIVVGVAFITFPALPCALLFAARLEGIAMPLARWVGVGLLTLGIACLPMRVEGPQRGAVVGLFSFNVGVSILFAWVGITTLLHGVLLWPVVILHAAIAAVLLPQLLAKDTLT